MGLLLFQDGIVLTIKVVFLYYTLKHCNCQQLFQVLLNVKRCTKYINSLSIILLKSCDFKFEILFHPMWYFNLFDIFFTSVEITSKQSIFPSSVDRHKSCIPRQIPKTGCLNLVLFYLILFF